MYNIREGGVYSKNFIMHVYARKILRAEFDAYFKMLCNFWTKNFSSYFWIDKKETNLNVLLIRSYLNGINFI